MKQDKKKKKRKLLFQIGVVLLPVFLLLMAGIFAVIYYSSVDGYLKAQDDHMKILLNMIYQGNFAGFKEDESNDNKLEWLYDSVEKDISSATSEYTDEEVSAYMEEAEKAIYGAWTYDWLIRVPGIVQSYCTKIFYKDTQMVLDAAYRDQNYSDIFVVDLTDPYRGQVLFKTKRNEGDIKAGDYFDLSATSHPAIESILTGDSRDIVFERSADIPLKGNYYIGYMPLYMNGKLRGAIGLVYDWEAIQNSILDSMKLAWILGIGGLILAMIIILTVLYRKSIRPLTKIQSIVRDYTKDKDTEETLARTAEITERNEFGLLSDDIRGMVQEIHDYTEENIRLAGEQERVQKELYEAQVSVMVSQIQPHFMYNALTSIAMMCELDPEKAQEATVIFADYLRGNMDSLKQKAPVPFSMELEHLKKYVYIEQLRFADKLRVEYDIGPTSFSLPQLSVQPLVENAVKHGVGMKKGGGTVTIATRENETSYEVIVSDNGVGFDVAAADQIRKTRSDGRSHVGMENTRKRLHDQCNADVIITSVVGEGTTARIVIPKNDSGQKDESSPKGV